MSELKRQLALERAMLAALKGDKLLSFKWVPKQMRFMNSLVRERIFSGGNQQGKSACALALTAMHLEGRYPDWYKGRRFDKPVQWAAAGPTKDATKDNITEKLFGPDFDGSGWLSKDSFEKPTRDAPRIVNVKHSSGGWSQLRLFSYDQGARRIQGRTLDGITLDESPSLPVVEEFSQRLNATRGELIIALSPKEETAIEVIDYFEDTAPLREVIYYGINDAIWMPKEQRDEIVAKNAYNPYSDATLHGKPVARTGLIYRTPPEIYTYTPFQLEGPSIIGIDFAHTTGTYACARLTKHGKAWHVEAEWKAAGITLEDFAQEVIKMGGGRLPVAFPHDGGRNVGDGMTAAETLRSLGCNMLPMPAYLIGVDGKKHKSIVTITEQLANALANGDLLVSSACPALFRELARFRWKNGKPGNKPQNQDDHIHDAVAKAWMMREFAEKGDQRPVPLTPSNSQIAHYFSNAYNPLAGAYGRRPWGRGFSQRGR